MNERSINSNTCGISLEWIVDRCSLLFQGSQVSINSVLSETKARYGLDVSGSIELKLTYALGTGHFDILINKCTNLAKARRNQTSDPYVRASSLETRQRFFCHSYVKIYLLPDRSKNSKRKTSVKKSTTDPVFEEKLRVGDALSLAHLRFAGPAVVSNSIW